MIHYYLDESRQSLDGKHYGVSSNETWVLVQLDDGVEQVRLMLRPDQAKHMAFLLEEHAWKVLDGGQG